jgi:uncharacterized protein
MAVAPSTVPDRIDDQVSDSSAAANPVRTCIGCRQRAVATELLRVVVAPDATVPQVVADPRRRMPGRGAWLHPTGNCVELAVRRRAFARALRVPAPDPAPVAEYVAQAGRA